MELWIRNQDRTVLINAKRLFVDEIKNVIYTSEMVELNLNIVKLGNYKTKERALEVLDDIQKRINYLDATSILDFSNKDTTKAILKTLKENNIENLSCIYEMPKE